MKRIIPDGGNAVWQGDAGQKGFVPKRIGPDSGDRQAGNRARNGDRTGGTIVPGDGNSRAITCVGKQCDGRQSTPRIGPPGGRG